MYKNGKDQKGVYTKIDSPILILRPFLKESDVFSSVLAIVSLF